MPYVYDVHYKWSWFPELPFLENDPTIRAGMAFQYGQVQAEMKISC